MRFSLRLGTDEAFVRQTIELFDLLNGTLIEGEQQRQETDVPHHSLGSGSSQFISTRKSLVQIPQWMFDSVACCRMRLAHRHRDDRGFVKLLYRQTASDDIVRPKVSQLTVTHKYGNMQGMKTTLEIPDVIFRRAKSVAAERGIPLRALISEALADKLRTDNGSGKPWMAAFGKLRRLRKETARINCIIEEEFEQIEAEDRL